MKEVILHKLNDWRAMALAVNELIRGRINTVGTVTLTANAASTVITNSAITPYSMIILSPTTANAAAALATTYVSSVVDGSATLTHANNAQVDKTFDYLVKTGDPRG